MNVVSTEGRGASWKGCLGNYHIGFGDLNGKGGAIIHTEQENVLLEKLLSVV